MSGRGGVPQLTVEDAAVIVRQAIFDLIHEGKSRGFFRDQFAKFVSSDGDSSREFAQIKASALSRLLPRLEAIANRLPDARFSITNDPKDGRINDRAIASQLDALERLHNFPKATGGKSYFTERWESWAARWLMEDAAFRRCQNFCVRDVDGLAFHGGVEVIR